MSKKRPSRINFHDTLRNGSFDHAVLCTYTFNPVFFEEYCLERFDSLNRTPNITVLTDQGTYNECLTGHLSNRPRQANVRYLLQPVRLPGSFHPKLFLFVSNSKGRLVIGSANFTRPGITSNAELINVFEYEVGKNEKFRPLFIAAYRFLVGIAENIKGRSLVSNLIAVEREAPWITEEVSNAGKITKSPVQFLHNLKEPLWEQIVRLIKPPIESVDILSLFFDAEPTLVDRVMEDLRPRTIGIYTENGRTTLTKQWLKHRTHLDGILKVSLVSYKDEGFGQPLHAKAIYIKSPNCGTLGFGSANFTTPALLRTSKSGNSEVVLLLTGFNPSKLPCRELFDPCGMAHDLQTFEDLKTAPRVPISREAEHLLVLHEAELENGLLRIDIFIPETVSWDRLEGTIRFTNDASTSVAIEKEGDNRFVSRLNADLLKRFDEGSTIISVMAFKGLEKLATSNSVLIANLLEIRSGQSLRRVRIIREAQSNVDQFFQVLNELLKGSDENPLIVFFNLCDIPVLEASGPGFLRRERPQWDGGEGMRSLGKRNLVIYRQLHDAAVDFFDRHFRKLRRHVEHGSLRGVSNYLHIFFAMGGVLRSQVERLVQGLEGHKGAIDVQTWGEVRSDINDYYRRFKDLSTSLYEGYVPKLEKESGWDAISGGFSPELKNLRALREDMVAFRDRLEALRVKRLRVCNPTTGDIEPKYFSCVFEEATWRTFVSTFDTVESTENRLTP